MKKLTKILSLISVGIMSFAALTACSILPGNGDNKNSENVADNYCTVEFELCTDLYTNNIMSQEVEIGGTVMKPIVAVIGENPNNSEVDSWYIDPEYTTAWNFLTDTVTEDMTLYAKWIGRFNINYYLGDETEKPMFTDQVKEGSILNPLSELSDGYRSNGFYTSSDYTEEFEFGKPVTKEENIYIQRSDEFYFSAGMIQRRFVAEAAPSGAGSKAGEISLAGEGEDEYAVVNFGYSTAADPYILLKNVTVDISHSQKIRMTFKNMGSATSLKFYFVAWFDNETKEVVDQQFFSETASFSYHYTEEQKNMTEEDEWLVLDFDISAATIKNGISLWGNAATLIQLRVQSCYISENEQDLSNELWVKSIEGISEPTYVNTGDSDELATFLVDDAAEKVEAAGNAQQAVNGWIFPKDNADASGDATFYQKETGLVLYSEFRKQNTTLILKATGDKSIDLDTFTTVTLRLQNFGYANSFMLTYRNKKGRSASQEVIINSRATTVDEYKLNMFGATNWNGLLDTLMITYNSVGNDNAILFESIIFSDFEVGQLHGVNFNDKYTFGLTSNDAMEVSYNAEAAGTLINVIDSAAVVIEKTYDVAYTIYGYSAITLNYKASAEGISKVNVGLTIGDVETVYSFDITLDETTKSLALEKTGDIQKLKITFEGTGEIVLRDIKFDLNKESSLNFTTGDLASYIVTTRKWGSSLAFDSSSAATLHSQAGANTYAKYYFGAAKDNGRGEGNIDLEGKSKIVIVYQNTGIACNLALAAGFANKTEDDSWKTQIVEPYDRTLGGSVQNQMLKGEMSENEWAYIEYDLLNYQNISAETINEKALAVILLEFADATLSTSIKIRAISVI